MRRLAGLALLLLFCASAAHATGYVQSSGFSAFTSATSVASTLTVTAANQGVFVVDYGSAGVGTWTCSDNKSDTWVVAANQATGNYGLIAYTLNLAGGSTTVTCSTTGSASNVSADFREYNGYPYFDAANHNNTATGATFTLTVTTTLNAADMLVAGTFDGAGMGFNAPTNNNVNKDSGPYEADGDGLTSSTGVQTITATQAGSFGGAIVVLALSPTNGGSACTTPTLSLMGVGTCLTENWENLLNLASCPPTDTACTEILEVCDQNNRCLTHTLVSVTAAKLCDTSGACLAVTPASVLTVSLVVNATLPAPQTLTSPLGTVSFQ